ncbi:MAG: glycosyltransferase [Clostridia bacterium]|nr:glycosyltransferase [Clostridia bacterium]
MSSKIGFDLTFIKDINKISGEEIIALNIVQAISENDIKSNIVFFTDSKVEKQLRKLYKNLRIVVTRKKGSAFYKKFLYKYIAKNSLGLMFYPHASNLMNGKLPCKSMALLHGLNSKEVSRAKQRKTVKFLMNCDRIIAVSEFVKKELLHKSRKITAEKITVIENPLADIRQGVEIVYKKKYLLCIGNDDYSKNLLSIVKAFYEVSGMIDHDLIIIGKINEKGKIFKFIKKFGISNRVIVTGHMDRDTLFGYYKNADLFINASIYEGFGLTPLEAMASGTRTLSTLTPSIMSLEEIECDGIINTPKDYKEIADTILIIVKAPCDQAYLKKRASKIMSKYDINKTVNRYIELFRETV